MLKRILPLFLALVLMLQSCSLIRSIYGFTPELEGKLDYVYTEDDKGRLIENGAIYMDTLYYKHHEKLIQVDKEDPSILITWNPAGAYTWAYYSYQEETPLYIYGNMANELFFRNDYDFFTDTYILEGTDAEILLCNEMKELYERPQEILNAFLPYVEMKLRSKTHPALYLQFQLMYYMDRWYMEIYTPLHWDYYALSEEFIEILAENNLLPTDFIPQEDPSEKTTEEGTN